MKTRSRVTATFSATIASAVGLIGQFNEKTAADASKVRRLFRKLERLTEALPPEQNLICNIRNRLPSCRDLWAAGEYMTARVQMVELVRKLMRHKAAWVNGLQATPAQPSAVVNHNIA